MFLFAPQLKSIWAEGSILLHRLRIVVVPSRGNLQHIVNQVAVVSIAAGEVYGSGVDDKQRSVVVVIKKLGVGIVQLLQVPVFDAALNGVTTHLH